MSPTNILLYFIFNFFTTPSKLTLSFSNFFDIHKKKHISSCFLVKITIFVNATSHAKYLFSQMCSPISVTEKLFFNQNPMHKCVFFTFLRNTLNTLLGT